MDFVKNILKLSKERGFTNKQLCELLGKNTSYITDWKNGKSKPKADEIIFLADYFNVSVDYLLGKTTAQTSPTPKQADEFSALIQDCSPAEREQVKQYIEFIKSQRKE